jgi:hypothetical protein
VLRKEVILTRCLANLRKYARITQKSVILSSLTRTKRDFHQRADAED